MVVLLYGFPDVVFFIPGLLCSNVFCFWSSYCTHGHKLGVAAGGILVGKSFWHLLHSQGHSFMWMARVWLCYFFGQLWCPRFYLKRIGGAGAGISFAWLPRLVLCDHTGNVIVT